MPHRTHLSNTMNVLLIDDHPLYRDGLKALVAGLQPTAWVYEAATVSDALSLVQQALEIDLVLLDMNLPGVSRLDALASVKAAFDSASIVVISADEDPSLILKTIEAGAAGYIPKSTDQLVTINALRIVLAHGVYLPPAALRQTQLTGFAARPAWTGGKPELSERQRAVLQCLLQGKANKVIARELNIAEGTVKAHLWAVYQILGVTSRVQAMCRAHELGMLNRLD